MKWFVNTMLNVSSFLKEWVVELIISTNTVLYLLRSPLDLTVHQIAQGICTELHAGYHSVPPPYD